MFREPAMYRDRSAGGRALARKLAPLYQKEDPIIVCIPNSSASMGRIIASKMNCEMDICLVRKIVDPTNPVLAIGAVCEDGDMQLLPSAFGVSRRYVDQQRQQELQKN